MLPRQVQWTEMTPALLDAVLGIEFRAYAHPWSRGNFEDSLRSAYWCPALMADGQLLAYMVAMPGVQESHLLNITVAPQAQGQGLGLQMLNGLVQWANDRADEWVWLEVRQSNQRALDIYRTFGFASVGRRPGYYPARDPATGAPCREDALVMSYRIHP